MFTAQYRTELRTELLKHGARDARITGCAITGSGAADAEDVWSDIDLAFGVRDANELPGVLADWTELMRARHGALHHLDVRAGPWIYRVFLLPNTLQVDLAFVPAAEFRPLAPTFRLASGEAQKPLPVSPPPAADLIGYGWLYALHVRSCIARGKYWQAEYMISGLRDTALSLACLRHGLPTIHGRGFDLLPEDVGLFWEGALVRQLERLELMRAFRVALDGLRNEIRFADPALAAQLHAVLGALSGGAEPEA